MAALAEDRRPVPPALLERLRCPTCLQQLMADEKALRCPSGHVLDCSRGFVDAGGEPEDPVTRATFRSFGYEWNTFSELDEDDVAFADWYLGILDPAQLSGRVGLDAGCGKGRFSRLLAHRVDALVAMDGSEAVVAATHNLADLPNTLVVKADLRDPPCEAGSFGFVACLGVLHHLADPAGGFAALARLLAPEGLLLVYLYSKPAPGTLRARALAIAAHGRRRTVRMRHRRLRALSLPLAALLYGGVVLPGRLGERLGIERLARLPLAAYRGRHLRSLWLDTFDRLSAPVEHRFTFEEVAPWFAAAGLDIEHRRDEHGLLVLARREAG